MTTSVFNPSIPYIGAVGEPKLSLGNMVKIQGLAPSIRSGFNIHLQCGQKVVPRDDVAIQISVNFLDGYISLNSLQQGVWGEEQRGSLTLKCNKKFSIIVICDINQYHVAVNGKHYWEFPQRIPPDRITHLAIDGDVSIFKISYESFVKKPIPTPPGSENGDVFEMIDTTANKSSQIGTKPPPPSIGFCQPPPYEAAIAAASRPPYPVSEPIGMPNVTDVVKTSYAWSPTGVTSARLLPTGDTSARLLPTGVTSARLAPIGVTPPLHATTSSCPHVQREICSRRAQAICGISFGIVIIIIVSLWKTL